MEARQSRQRTGGFPCDVQIFHTDTPCAQGIRPSLTGSLRCPYDTHRDSVPQPPPLGRQKHVRPCG